MSQKKPINVWLEVTLDEYELPTAVADSAKELGEIVGASKNTIISGVSHARHGHYRSRFVKVEIEEDDNEYENNQ